MHTNPRITEIVIYLYQIYCPLAFLSDEFTHYDLHSENVLIHQPSKNNTQYIKMIYHYPDDSVVEIKTFGIAKIIDYGRCYFHDREQNLSSKDFYDMLCKTKECDPDCGKHVGFSTLGPEHFPGSFYHISSQKRNASHDLRLFYMISRYFEGLQRKLEYTHEYGTAEIIHNENIFERGGKIKNVKDAHLYLKYIIMTDPMFMREIEQRFAGTTEYGELHCWVDGSRPMQFTKH